MKEEKLQERSQYDGQSFMGGEDYRLDFYDDTAEVSYGEGVVDRFDLTKPFYENKTKDNKITITEEVTIGDHILEVGDRIQVFQEGWDDDLTAAVQSKLKNISPDVLDIILDWYTNEYMEAEEINAMSDREFISDLYDMVDAADEDEGSRVSNYLDSL